MIPPRFDIQPLGLGTVRLEGGERRGINRLRQVYPEFPSGIVERIDPNAVVCPQSPSQQFRYHCCSHASSLCPVISHIYATDLLQSRRCRDRFAVRLPAGAGGPPSSGLPRRNHRVHGHTAGRSRTRRTGPCSANRWSACMSSTCARSRPHRQHEGHRGRLAHRHQARLHAPRRAASERRKRLRAWRPHRRKLLWELHGDRFPRRDKLTAVTAGRCFVRAESRRTTLRSASRPERVDAPLAVSTRCRSIVSAGASRLSTSQSSPQPSTRLVLIAASRP